jgi:1-acyl-sn-glycerol-3-phosphate acyltransferase
MACRTPSGSPFGGGTRRCLGASFATFEMRVAIRRVLERTDLRPVDRRPEKGLRKKHVARAHTGAARIALAAGVPLVPAAISGTDRLRYLAPLRVAYGAPLDIDDLRGHPPDEVAQEATDRLMRAIYALEDSLT